MCITQKFYTSIVKKIPSFLNASCAQLLSHICLFATPWIIACQAPLSMEFSRQEYWKGLPFANPGDLPDPGLELRLLRLLRWQADSSPLHHVEAILYTRVCISVPSSHVILLLSFLGNHKFIFNICDYFHFVSKLICIIFFRFHMKAIP